MSTLLATTLGHLASFPTRAWLQERVAAFDAPPPRPHVVVVDSDPSGIQAMYGHPLRQDAAWQVVAPDDAAVAHLVDDADVIVWGMSALRLFPGEAAVILNQARQDALPILAVVTNTERVGDPNGFAAILSQWQGELPPGSAFFVGPAAFAEMTAALLAHGTDWARARRPTRFAHLKEAAQREIRLEQVGFEDEVLASENALVLAQTGVAAGAVQCESAIVAILHPWQACMDHIAAFLHTEMPHLAKQASRQDQLTMVAALQSAEAQWHVQFSAQQQTALETSLGLADLWCTKLTEAAQACFSKYARLQPAVATATAALTFTEPAQRLASALRALDAATSDLLQQFTETWQIFLIDARKAPAQAAIPHLPEPTPIQRIVIDRGDSAAALPPTDPPRAAAPAPTNRVTREMLLSQVGPLIAQAQLSLAQQEFFAHATNQFSTLYNGVYHALQEDYVPLTEVMQTHWVNQTASLLVQCEAEDARVRQRAAQLQRALAALKDERL